MRRSRSLLASAALAALLVSGCGDDASVTDGANDASTTTEAAEATSTTTVGDTEDDTTDDTTGDATGDTVDAATVMEAMEASGTVFDEATRTCIAEGMGGRLSRAALPALDQGELGDLGDADLEVARTTFNDCVELTEYAALAFGQADAGTVTCVTEQLTARFEGVGDLLVAIDDDASTVLQEITTSCLPTG